MGFWSDIVRRKTQDWTYGMLNARNVPFKSPVEAILPEEVYIDVTLRSMRVVHVRRGLTRFHGVVHSAVSLPHLSGKLAEFSTVISPDSLKNADASHLDRVIQVDQCIAGPIPYRGGRLEMEIGLFSVKEADLAAPYITLLQSLSKTAGVSFINAALPFVEPLKLGVNLLTGSNDSTVLEIGLSESLDTPKTGWYAVIRAPKTALKIAELRVARDDFRLLDGSDAPIGDFPYMVFSIFAAKHRADWFLIPDLKEPYARLQDAVRRGKSDEAAATLTVFRTVALTCPDLIATDAEKLAARVASEVSKIIRPEKKMLVPTTLPSLKDIGLY